MTQLCRTFQTAPAGVPKDNTAKYLESAFTAMGFQVPDWLVPDIEDGTAPSMKETALENTVELSIEYGPAFGGESALRFPGVAKVMVQILSSVAVETLPAIPPGHVLCP